MGGYDRFVRFRETRTDGFVEFVFSIGDPELGVEMILPRLAFDEFCKANQVHFLTSAEAARIDADASRWRYGIPGLND
jgi:phenol hydroxylase P0 protein